MRNGQEDNIPFVITCCSSIALVDWGTPGGTWMASPQSEKGRTGQRHHLPRHLHISLRHMVPLGSHPANHTAVREVMGFSMHQR